MDATHLLDLVFSVLLAVGGWWVSNIWKMVISLQIKLAALEVDLARNYVPRVELQATFARIEDKLDQLLRGKQP